MPSSPSNSARRLSNASDSESSSDTTNNHAETRTGIAKAPATGRSTNPTKH